MNRPKTHRGVSLAMWTDEKFVSLSPLARLLWIGSWHYCCDSGHLDATPLELKMRVLPADNCDIDEVFGEIVAAGLMVGDAATGYTVPNLSEHQKIDKRWALRCHRCSREDGDGTGGRTSGPREDHASDTRGAREDSPRPRPEVNRSEVKGSEGGAGEDAPAKADKTAPRKRGTRLPDIFPITSEMAEWGREHAPDVNAPREHEKFCDYWRGVSGQRGVKADWIATWRNWMRRAQEDIGPAQRKRRSDDLPDWMLA